MKYLFTLLVSVLFFCFQPFLSESFAQQHFKTGTIITATSTSFALGNSGAVHTQLLYNPTDLTPVPNNGNITKLWFKRAGATNVTLTNFSIKLGQTSANSGFTNGAAFNTGLSTVFSTTGWTSPSGAANTWFSIDITSFPYDPAFQLIVDLSFSSSSNETFTIASTITSGTTQNKLYAASNAILTGTSSTNWADIGLSFAAPTNDNCASATLLSPSRNCAKTTVGTTMGATASFTTTSCAGFLSTSSDDEVWYSFVAEGTGDTVTVSGIGSFDPVIEAFASCGSVSQPVRIGCSDASTTGGTETLIFQSGTLTAGNTYRIRVFSFDSYRGYFNICLRNKNAISNDDCSSPIPLTARASCQAISATTAGATQSLPVSFCGGFTSTTANDVWFSFTAFNPTDSIIVNGQGSLDAVVQILDGCNLNGYSICTDVGGAGLEILSPGDLIPGKTYLVRVYGWNGAEGSFSICHKYFGAPTNDECAGAVNLQVGTTCSFTARNTFNATRSDGYSDCSGSGDDDVWFSFTSPSSQVEIDVTQTLVTSTAFFTFNPVIEVYGNCNPASFITCVNTAPTNGTSIEKLNLTGLTPGQTYYIRVYHAGTGSGNVGFNICLVNTFCDPQVGTAKIISPLTSDVLSNGSVQVGVTGHSGSLVWEYSTDGISFTPDPSLTSDIATFVPKTTTDTKYYFRAAVTDGLCSPKYSDTVSINVRCHSPISFTSLSDGTYISNVSLSDLDRTSTFDPLGGAYQDFRKDTAHLCLGGTRIVFARLKLSISSSINSYQRMVWVDLNRNGSFGDPGEILHSGSSLASATTNINLVFPSSIEEGVYPMRIAIYSGAFGNGNPDNPCASNLSIPFGEIEEYTLRIYRNPIVNAGADIDVCVPSVQLNALYPGASHTGTWTVRIGSGVTGEGIIANPHDTNSVVTNLKPGINSFIWTVTGPCGNFTDTIDVNFIKVSANAGTDQAVCTTMVFLNATPPTVGSGFWTVLEGSGSFTNQQGATSLVFGPAIGINRYVWTVTSGNCPAVSDTVIIVNRQNPTFANAGLNQTVCGATFTTLTANTPTVGTGKWTVISGSGNFTNDTDPNTTVTNLGLGLNSFRWTISNPPCFPTSDDVNVLRLNPVIANAGIDQTICQDTVLLVGNDPNDEGISTSWTQIAGTGSIFNNQAIQTQVAGLASGINRFVYSIFETGCPVSRDTVDVDRKIQPGRATTGTDQTICSSSTTITGNNPSVGTGKWTRISGQGTIQNPSSNSTQVTNIGAGANVFRWTISNPPCADRFAEITIFRNVAIPAQAGVDQVICTTFVQMNAVDPAIDGVGISWTQIAGTSSTFNPNSATATFFSLTAGLNRYVYSVTVPGCPASTDTVDITRNLPPTTANAGINQTVCSSNSTLAGNTATSGTGVWSRISGAGTVTNTTNPTSGITGLGLGANVFRWTISNPPCADSFDEVTIFRTTPIIANAGTDQVICTTFVQLSGNVIVGNSGNGTWTQIQGTGLIGNPNSATTTVNNLSAGLNRFVYSITTPSCPNPSTDTVDVNRSADPTIANAGNNQTVCSSNATLAGNTGTSGTGLWTRISGAGTITNTTNPTSGITGLGIGANVFRWTISNPPCADSFDEVTIFRTSPIIANAGTDQVICTTFVQLNGNVIVGNSGTSTWTQIQGTGLIGNPNSASTTVNNLSAGLNRFVYSITTPSCPNPSTDTVDVNRSADPTIANAGNNQTVCSSNATLAGNIATSGTGVWTRISGTGTITNSTNPTSGIIGLGLGANIFRWTISNPPCADSFDEVTIFRTTPIIANAGTDQVICTTFVQLNGNVIVGNSGNSTWTQIQGTGLIGNPNSASTTVNNLSAGLNRFVYSITTPSCPNPSTDTVAIRVNSAETAQAGPDQTIFVASTNLAAINPTGTWTRISGTGTISNPTNPASLVTGLGLGNNVFVWTFNVSPCPVSTDTVVITRNNVPNVCQGISLVAQSTGGANASILLQSPQGNPFFSHSLTFGDGASDFIEGGNFSGSHTYPSPGTYNVCARLYYSNVFQELDSCDVCDTVRIPVPTKPCASTFVTASHTSGFNASINLNSTDDSFVRYSVDFGDGTSGAGTGSGALLAHSYSASGTFNVCGRFYYFDAFQKLDSCEKCDTVNIPVPFNPCDAFHVTNLSTTKTDILEPISMRGYWYELSDSVSFAAGSIQKVTMRVFDAVTNETQLDGSLIPGTGDSFMSFNLTIPPGQKRICYTGYFGSGNGRDSCTVCYLKDLPAPDFCEFFDLKTQQVCRNTVEWKEIFSAQAAPDSVLIDFGDGQSYQTTINGDSGTHTYSSPGTYQLCAYGKNPLGVTNFIPGPNDCKVCKTIVVDALPNAGPDQTICLDNYSQIGSVIPTGYLARWEVVSSSATLNVSIPENLVASGLSAGANVFRYVFFKANQTCPDEADTLIVTRVLPVVANAGPDQSLFTSSTNLAADNPTGSWTKIAGSGSIINPSSPTSNVTGLSLGENIFVWAVSQSPCALSTDTVIINRNPIPNVCLGISLAAQSTGGANASIVLTSPTTSSFISNQISYGDGIFNGNNGGNFSGNHAYPAPGLYNVCAKLYYVNVFQQLDSCELCDTVRIPEIIRPCSSLTITASHVDGLTAGINLSSSDPSFTMHVVSFGDGVLSTIGENGSGIYSHTYDAPGTYNVCARVFFNDVFQRADSCEICDTVNIPVPFNPCDSFKVTRISTTKTDVFEPDSMRGYWYSLSDNVSFVSGSINKVMMRVFDAETNENQLEGNLIPGSGATFLNFNLTIPPGKKRVCYTGYFVNGQVLDSCTICYTDSLPFPPVCDFFSIDVKQICRNTAQFKVHYSGQSAFDSVWVAVNGEGVVRIPASGDSVSYTFSAPGKYKICAQAFKESIDVLKGSPLNLTLPGGICQICDSLEIAPGPDAGLDDTICASIYDRNGFGIPDGYLADWSVVSGGATLDLTEPFNLRASNLSAGENKFVYRYLTADQSCPSETDTMSIFRVLPVFADAGTDQSVNATSAILAAGNAIGTWSVLSGGATVTNLTDPASAVSNLGLGANKLVWTVTSSPCAPSSDTIIINRSDACTSLSLTASHTTGYFSNVKPDWPTGGPFFSVKVKFGDGTESTEMTSPDSQTHLYAGPGIYTVCGRFLYFNTAQQLDSCIICDTVNIPEFISPCDSFGVDVVVVKSIVDVNPEETQGWYYDYAVNLSNTSRFSTTKFRFDDGPLLDVANYGIANTAFTYIQTPSDSLRKLCVIGYYEGPYGKTDSCVVCQEFSNPFPPVCDFLKVNLTPVCRNSADVKVQFSTQSRFDSVWVSINEDSLIHIPASGDSVRLTFAQPGKYRICAVANGAAGRPLNLDLPGFTCAVCDSLTVLPAPDAGNDTTICGSDFIRNGKEIPSGYSGGWLVTQGTGTVSGFSDNNLAATNLSQGLNQFVYRFVSQTCATETDTVNVFRETGDLSDAGQDQTICADTTNLAANLPSGSHTGHWTVVQGTGTFEDANSPVTQVYDLSVGLNKFRWIISNGVCPADSNEVEISRLAPSVANAGLDKTVCSDSTFLQASGTSGSGFWSLVSGNGVLTDDQNPQSPVSHLNVGPNTFVWTTISQICPVDTDQVIITFAPPIHAFGGFDDTVYVNQDTLKGNNPGIGTSKWNKLSGSSIVLTPFNSETVVTDLSPGLNEFVYTVRNPICQTEDKAANADSVTSDTVRIYYFIPVQANAGSDTSICASTPFQLYGNLPGQGTGQWTILEGSGTISDPANPVSTFTNPGSGTNRLIWAVTTPGLDASTDTITVQVSQPPTEANAGTDKVICETFLNLDGNTPSIGTGTWNVLIGSGTLSNANEPSAGISNLSLGLNQLSWTISNGVCPSTTDSVYIVVSPPLNSDAGIDQTICGDTITLNGSPVPLGATGEWKVAAGAGTFSNPTASSTLVTGLAPGVNSFHWVLKNGVCPADSDFVAITSVASPSVAVAGDDQSVCGTSGILNADPQNSGSGVWTVLSGSAVVEFPTLFNSSYTGLGIGQNQLVWTISNAPCASTSDTLAITGSEMPVANAGLNANACGDSATLEAVIGPGQSGTWSTISGTGIITTPTSASTTVSGITTKVNSFIWTIVSGACSASDTVTIINQFNPLAFGPDKVICEDSILVLDAGSGFTSYLWNNGSATQTISVDTAGTYSVTIQTLQGCTFSDTITVIETICTDVDPLLTSKLNWSLYPNPGQGKLMIRLDNAIPGVARLKLYSNLGVLVFEDPAFGIRDGIEMQVQLPTLPDGVYYLELSGTGYRLKEKLVIRK